MYVLGIDTSTLTGGVALLQAEQLIGESVLNIRTTHSERLLPALETLLNDGGVKAENLGLISTVTGPGSFTGIRIGVATAKGLGYALCMPMVGVTTLEAYGWQFKFFPGLVLSLVDARRNRVFWQAFQDGTAVSPPAHGSLEEVYAWCAQQATKEFLCVGDGAVNYAEGIRENVAGAVFSPPSLSLLRPSSVAHLGYTRFLSGEVSHAFDLNPTYMRQTEAELKWQEQA